MIDHWSPIPLNLLCRPQLKLAEKFRDGQVDPEFKLSWHLPNHRTSLSIVTMVLTVLLSSSLVTNSPVRSKASTSSLRWSRVTPMMLVSWNLGNACLWLADYQSRDLNKEFWLVREKQSINLFVKMVKSDSDDAGRLKFCVSSQLNLCRGTQPCSTLS